jgi:hypothetical protein
MSPGQPPRAGRFVLRASASPVRLSAPPASAPARQSLRPASRPARSRPAADPRRRLTSPDNLTQPAGIRLPGRMPGGAGRRCTRPAALDGIASIRPGLTGCWPWPGCCWMPGLTRTPGPAGSTAAARAGRCCDARWPAPPTRRLPGSCWNAAPGSRRATPAGTAPRWTGPRSAAGSRRRAPRGRPVITAPDVAGGRWRGAARASWPALKCWFGVCHLIAAPAAGGVTRQHAGGEPWLRGAAGQSWYLGL